MSFTPLWVRTHVKRPLEKLKEYTTFTPLWIRTHVKHQISLFNFESWMSLSEVHLALNKQARHCVSS